MDFRILKDCQLTFYVKTNAILTLQAMKLTNQYHISHLQLMRFSKLAYTTFTYLE